MERREQYGPKRKRGRKEVISSEVRWKLRERYLTRYREWGPTVLSHWAQRERLGGYSPGAISRVIGDLKLPRPPKKTPRRYEIAAPGVMWSEDGSDFWDRGRKKELVLLQDECCRYKIGRLLVDGPAKGADVLQVLEEAFLRHPPPLVLKRDGGSIFDDDAVMALLDRYHVVVVTSPPGYPPYNGKKERSFRDVKSFERAMRRDLAPGNLAERIDEAIHDLNDERPRPVLKGRTASEVYHNDRIPLPDRQRFKMEVETRQMEIETEAGSRHQRDAARRQAVNEILFRYGFIKWKGNVSTYSEAHTRT